MFVIVLVALFAHIPLALAQSCPAPAPLSFEIAGQIKRSALGFTQGLEFRDGKLYESTGRIAGNTQLNVIALDGTVTTLVDLGQRVFGEGLTILNDEIFQLTWQEHDVYVYDLAGKLKRTMRNPREGWGLANDGKQLIFSDGGPAIYFTEPKDFSIKGSRPLRTNQPGAVHGLNELEFIAGKLWGNIFTTRLIVRLDPASGCIDGVADLAPLWNAMPLQERARVESSADYVLNGIAHDAATGNFYLTGKRWSTIFVGRFGSAP